MDQTAAVVAAWREVQSRPFVIPEEMTDLAIALDRLVAAHETAPTAERTCICGLAVRESPGWARGWTHGSLVRDWNHDAEPRAT